MENQGQQTNSRLSESVVSEIDLLAILNIEQPVLNDLRLEKGFPVVRLNNRNRVYLIEDVRDWLKAHRDTGSGVQRKPATASDTD